MRSAGAVPSTIAAMMRGDRKAKGGEQADVPFALDLTLSNLGEGSNTAEPDVVDPSPSLGEGGEKRLAGFGFHRRFCAGRMNDAFYGRKAWRGPGKRDRGRRRVPGSRVINRFLACLLKPRPPAGADVPSKGIGEGVATLLQVYRSRSFMKTCQAGRRRLRRGDDGRLLRDDDVEQHRMHHLHLGRRSNRGRRRSKSSLRTSPLDSPAGFAMTASFDPE